VIYLCEDEIGYDAAEIGFPAVDGCRAVVLATSNGLFGYHIRGTLRENKKIAFAGFVNRNPLGITKKALYAASSQAGPVFYAEIRELARTLGYNGTIFWATLAANTSSYVNFVGVNHNTCIITSRAWNAPVDNVVGNKTPYVPANRATAIGAPRNEMFANVNPAGLTAVYPAPI